MTSIPPNDHESYSGWWKEGFEDGLQALMDISDAPETYNEFELPDDFDVDDPEMMSEFHDVARALNLTQLQAQKLIDMYIEHQRRMHQRITDGWKQTHADWQMRVSNDPELGGPARERTLARAHAAIKAFGSEDLVDALNELGAGNNPEILRFFARVGQMLEEDSVVSSPLSDSAMRDKSLSERLWPNGQ